MKPWHLCLSLLVARAAAQDPRIAADPRLAQYQHQHQHQHSPPADPLETGDMSTAALTKAEGTGGGYFGLARKFFDAAVMGKVPAVDLAERAQRDAEDGVERVTDANWGHTVGGGSESDVWVVLIMTPPSHPIDFHYLDSHRNATALAKERQGIAGVHWARVDYLTEVEICTRWLIFRGPVLAIVTDRGMTSRFVQKYHLIEGGRGLFNLIESGDWKDLPIWTSRYAPGGDRSYLVELYLKYSTILSSYTSRIPNLVWLGMFAALTQSVMKWLHTRNGPAAAGTAPPQVRRASRRRSSNANDPAAAATRTDIPAGASEGGSATRRLVEANRARRAGRSRSGDGRGSGSSETIGAES